MNENKEEEMRPVIRVTEWSPLEALQLKKQLQTLRAIPRKTEGIPKMNGISWNSSRGTWSCRVSHKGETRQVGTYHLYEEAVYQRVRLLMELNRWEYDNGPTS